MPEAIINKIVIRFKKAKGGTLFFTDSFAHIANKKAVSKSLERLVEQGEIIRVANGIYTRPQWNPVLGQVKPNIDQIAQAVAKRDKAKIVPTGEYALQKLGLSTQVPMKIVFLTDGSSRKLRIGNFVITFKKVTTKSVSAIGQISKLAIQALKSIGKDKVDQSTIVKIQELLINENVYHLEHDLLLVPEWIRNIFRPVLEKLKEKK